MSVLNFLEIGLLVLLTWLTRINPINVDFGFAGLNKLDPERYPLY